MEYKHPEVVLSTWRPKELEVVEESKIKYVCDLLTYKVLSKAKKGSILTEWVQKRLQEGRMYMQQAPIGKEMCGQWKVYKGARDPFKKIDHNFFWHMDVKNKESLREVIQDSTRGYVELY